MRILKLIVGLALLPFCVAATRTLWFLIRSVQPSSLHAVPLAGWGLFIGFALWIVVFFSLPRPVRAYVFAHELTHALWGWAFGARVQRVNVSARSGSTTLSKSNFLISLAPYFFPLYTILVIAGYYVLSVFFDLRTYEPFWVGLIGLTWGFHLTFTLTALRDHQPDVRENGYLFSYAVIYLLNVAGIGLWMVLVASPTLQDFVERLNADIGGAWLACAEAGRWVWRRVGELKFEVGN